MNKYKEYFIGSIISTVGSVIIGLSVWFWQQWSINDLEYKEGIKNSYLSASLGQQGFSMAYNEQPLKNISVVEFLIYNRTQKQVGEFELLFLIKDIKAAPKLVSSSLISSTGVPQFEAVDEIVSNDPSVIKYKIKIFPKQNNDSEYFDAIFVFDGDKTPEINLLAKGISLKKYSQWREVSIALIAAIVLGFLMGGLIIIILNCFDFYFSSRRHKKNINSFIEYIRTVPNSFDSNTLLEIKKVYSDYKKPKYEILSKIFGERKYGE